MKIGPFELGIYMLAPMAGISQMPFRLIVRELGASLAPTELISAEGLARKNKRTFEYLRYAPDIERPFCVQLFGGDPKRVAEAALIARDAGAQILDINMGCPVPKVTRGGGGSALMTDCERACSIVSEVRSATNLPVTAKIRSGWDSGTINAPAFAAELEKAGVSAVAVHARTRAQGYSGRADWSVIAAVKKAVQIPVIGNGDIASQQDAQRMLSETRCDAVMVGRAALGNPWIFRELLGGPSALSQERTATILRHLDDHLAFFGNCEAGIRSFRKMLLWYARGLKGAAQFRVEATHIGSRQALTTAITNFFAGAEPEHPGSRLELEDVEI